MIITERVHEGDNEWQKAILWGCKDVKEWMQKSPWYREFELGREAERKLRREQEWEREKLKTRFNIAGLGNVRQCCNVIKAIKMPPSVTITSRFSSKIELLVV
ncbi:MAG: hypothetical protein J6J67_05165 [Treponema sp.]|nr:hypothetical protein [Treponema sp.]